MVNGQTWEFQVRTKGDNDVRSGWSALQSVTANVETAPGPSNIIPEPRGNDLVVMWVAVTDYNVDRYGVMLR
jgi:chitodextrinase